MGQSGGCFIGLNLAPPLRFSPRRPRIAGSDVGTDAPDFGLQTVSWTIADTGAEAKTQNLEVAEHFFVNIEKRNFDIAGEGQLEVAANGPRMPRE